MADYSKQIKRNLEYIFDIPIVVEKYMIYSDDAYKIYPFDDNEGLFDIHIYFRDKIRLIIEINPQRYAMDMLTDMQISSSDKKQIFDSYIEQILERKAKINLKINDNSYSRISDIQHVQWNKFSIRITKSPVVESFEDFQEYEVIKEWSEITMGMMLSLLYVEQMESAVDGYSEGNVKQVLINKYERNPINRELCLAAHGYICQICGFDFEKKYGPIGHHFIHVHHLVPVSKMGDNYHVNPVTEMIPVCPNCHAMLHTSDPPLSPDELHILISKYGS